MSRIGELSERLSAGGRGDYQVRDMTALLDERMKMHVTGADWPDKNKWALPFWLPHGAQTGTGKTPSTIIYNEMVRAALRESGDDDEVLANKPTLIVTPNSVAYNWLDELHRWLPELNLADIWLLGGPPESRNMLLEMLPIIKPKYLVANYDKVRIHQQAFQNLGDEENPFFLSIIADEVQAIKWQKSQRTRAVMSIMAHFHAGLSATLLTNKPDSLWNVLRWIANSDTFYRTTRGDPPEPNQHCPLEHWEKRQLEFRGQGCTGCRFWNKDEGACKQYLDGKVQRKPHSDQTPDVTIRYRYASRYWGREDSFNDRYCLYQWTRYGRRVTGARQSMMPELHDRLKKFGLIRWRLAEVLPMDKPLYQHVVLEATETQAKLYNQLRLGFIEMWEGQEFLGVKRIRSILAQLTYFRRATSLNPQDFMTALQGKRPEFAPGLSLGKGTRQMGAKQEWLAEFIDQEVEALGDDVKFLVFSEWTDVLNPLEGFLASKLKMDSLVPGAKPRSEGLGQASSDFDMVPARKVKGAEHYLAMLTGDTETATRQAISKAWNSKPDFKVILASGAAFEGLNLQGGLSKDGVLYVIVLNFPWMPYQVIQMIGRGWRWGQDGQVIAMFPAVKGTIDHAMSEMLRSKQEAFDAAIDGDEQAMANLFEVTTVRSALDLVGTGA